ncbi:PQQ-dependent sugar dehydrogenase [Cellvibrio sp. NN19]|uniref:PQQ-dependent sugar dehydrogenase n=1 Tax=Cellvibrio chitinivorans TaxID=3102792 RepID=UPI002B40BBD2|nr:PQQ-dependent sugar dehydrogenase [Cellvibrio sp. NN19]
MISLLKHIGCLFCAGLPMLYAVAVNAGSYTTVAGNCDGFAQLPVVTQAGTCLGLVARRDAKNPLKMPRTLVQTDDDKLLVVDMGGWAPRKGQLLLLDYRNQNSLAKVLLNQLNLPHKILRGVDGKFYVGEADRIRRFSLENGEVVGLETVVDNLPVDTEYLHPLKNFTFDERFNLLVNIGSSSDRCDKKTSLDDCISGKEASIRRYHIDKSTNTYSADFEIIARGLRNSMALVVHTSGTILQAENSIDFPDAEEPYEELNIIANGNRFYGWPLCFNRDVSIEGGNCKQPEYQQPWTLLPPHVAPLDMIYYSDTKLPGLQNKLLMSWHGYRIVGNRLVSYSVDNLGRPELQQEAVFWRAPTKFDEPYTQHIFAPKGGIGGASVKKEEKKVAQHQEVISQWNEIPGVRPEGAPVGLTQARDGSIFIVDDRNAAILRLSVGEQYQPKTTGRYVSAKSLVPPAAVREVLQQRCAQCHSELLQEHNNLLTLDNWLIKQDGRTKIEIKVFEDKSRPMPPDGSLSDKERKILKDWFVSI